MKKMIPSALTLGNLLLGFVAILFVFESKMQSALLLILFGLLCDFLDGYCARKLDAASEMGKQLDSLADLVTFGIAPAIFVYSASLQDIEVLGIACCLVYVCCCALRLARFNVTQSSRSGFVGMPTPLAAMFALALTLLSNPFFVSIGMLILGALMVSRLPFPDLKKDKPEVAKDC